MCVSRGYTALGRAWEHQHTQGSAGSSSTGGPAPERGGQQCGSASVGVSNHLGAAGAPGGRGSQPSLCEGWAGGHGTVLARGLRQRPGRPRAGGWRHAGSGPALPAGWRL